MPAPYSWQSRRKATLVIPAIGASTTGGSTSYGPIFSAGSLRVAVTSSIVACGVDHVELPSGSARQRVVKSLIADEGAVETATGRAGRHTTGRRRGDDHRDIDLVRR